MTESTEFNFVSKPEGLPKLGGSEKGARVLPLEGISHPELSVFPLSADTAQEVVFDLSDAARQLQKADEKQPGFFKKRVAAVSVALPLLLGACNTGDIKGGPSPEPNPTVGTTVSAEPTTPQPDKGKQETTGEFLFFGKRAPVGFVTEAGSDYSGIVVGLLVGEVIKKPYEMPIKILGKQEKAWVVPMRFNVKGQNVNVNVLLGTANDFIVQTSAQTKELPFVTGGDVSIHHAIDRVKTVVPLMQKGEEIAVALPISGEKYAEINEERASQYTGIDLRDYLFQREMTETYMEANNLLISFLKGEVPVEDAPQLPNLVFSDNVAFPASS